MKSIRIEKTNANLEVEPFIRPFGFKGGYIHGAWQGIAGVRSRGGCSGLGLCTQGVLWSDAAVFSEHSEAAGNALMFAMLDYALKRVEGTTFTSPIEVMDQILPDVYEYGKKITSREDLRLTFALNSLIALDNALWQLYADENGLSSFDEMLPGEYSDVLSFRHSKLACIPLMAYAIPLDEIRQAADDGFFFIKVKIGSDPDKDGDREKMLKWDMARIEEIHKAIGGKGTAHTENGKIPYYFDANGRYDSKDRLRRLIDHADKIGALEQIAIIEEPFPEEYEEDVSDLGVRIAADESAHSDRDAEKRIEMGYGAIALKPIAKTLSMSLKIAKTAHRAGVPCFCADLTVIPILVDWNKNVAARLAPLPGMAIGVLETNGHQNYRNWDTLCSYHPSHGAEWTKIRDGLFNLSDEFFEKSGGILETPEHYASLVSIPD